MKYVSYNAFKKLKKGLLKFEIKEYNINEYAPCYTDAKRKVV